MIAPEVTVVVAVEHSQRNLPAILARIAPRRSGPVEVIIARAKNDGIADDPATHDDNVVTVEVAQGSRIPHMWAQGIRVARGSFVALTTAHCVPEADWISRIQGLDMAPDLAGIGGIFRNSRSASAMDWAIFLLRYRQFSADRACRDVTEIAADNAVYRKTELLLEDDLLDGGFWEPEFHARFRGRGLRLALDPSLKVVHRNRYTFRQFASQRVEHGEVFGSTRAANMSLTGNLAFLLVSPALPLVFLRKIIGGVLSQKEYRGQTFRALPWLLAFVTCWSYGEGRGYLFEFSRRLVR